MSGLTQKTLQIFWLAVVFFALLLVSRPASAQRRSRAPAYSAPITVQAHPPVFNMPSRSAPTPARGQDVAITTAHDRFLHTTAGYLYRTDQQRSIIVYIYTLPLDCDEFACYALYSCRSPVPHRCCPPVFSIYEPTNNGPVPSIHGSGAWYPPYGVYVPNHPQRGTSDSDSFPTDAVGAYYLGSDSPISKIDVSKLDPALRATIADITQAFQHNEFDALARHLPTKGVIAVYLRGQYSYALPPDQFLQRTRQGLTASLALSFGLHGIRQIDPNTYQVTGIHVFKDSQGNERMGSVGYILQKQGATYVLLPVEVNSP